MRKELLAIRKLLLIIVVPLILYLLNLLSVIFIPFTFALFAALLFSPLMRWFRKKGVPNFIGVIIVLLIVSTGFKGAYEMVQLTGKELTSADDDFVNKFEDRINDVVSPVVDFMGIHPAEDETKFQALMNDEKISANIFGNVGNGLNMAKNFITMLLMTLFFMVLLLAGSMNMQKVMELLIFRQKHASVKTFRQIEKDIFKFIVVKFILSFFTGLGFSLACYAFDVSFPIFWGVFAFLINFIQMIGSVISVVVLTIFALVELNVTGTLLFFIIIITGVQALFGGIIEPILMGKSFSINTVTVLIMLALWGFIWGIPGLILSIPLTALIKKIMEKFPGTSVYARIMS
ncbi:AI-2E family transporter [Brumimicrobium glaciale]|jgi:predicted PurR-regulated permease PerM|uniref:AI-2E family transporter n=1 Tax=Brumimicrobium glaciale TaxID=200475 RepID=A0A4V1WFQ2_9FLAO|nr:AI-2E family transporter [Brumimicrobium glaciale]RYM33986.1 AI-2E family transporter [Brumimicrobium glaciale]